MRAAVALSIFLLAAPLVVIIFSVGGLADYFEHRGKVLWVQPEQKEARYAR